MGYTHYFPNKKRVTREVWAEVTNAFTKAFNSFPKTTPSGESLVLQYEYDENSPVVIDKEMIRFNGAGDDGHETFLLPRVVKKVEPRFLFCKTNRKPYDFAVCSALILADRFAPGCYEISSDGEAEDWMPALEYLRSALEMPDLQLPIAVQTQNPDDAAIDDPSERGVFEPGAVWF